MFLDDKLLQMCEQAEMFTPEDVQAAYNALIQETQSYYISRIHKNMSAKEVKTTINRCFALWDSFTRQAKEHEDVHIRLFGQMCEKVSFKQKFLSDPKVAEIYNKL